MSKILPLEGNLLSNEDLYLKIADKVAKDIFRVRDEMQFSVGPLSSNYYSFTFSMKINASNKVHDVFVKVPKEYMRGSTLRILPITSKDRQMAKEEELSLRFLDRNWNNKELDVCWVKLLGVIPEYNAIVTQRIFANEAFVVYRNWELRRRLGFYTYGNKLQQSMSKIGSALGGFHKSNAEKHIFYISDLLPKIKLYCKQISNNTSSKILKDVIQDLELLKNTEFESYQVKTLKGIDIRNILIDSDNTLYILDPGKIKITYREADLARFLTTYRILFWGSLVLPIVKFPDYKAEKLFLESYYSNSFIPEPQVLNFFLLKEQLKHWDTALDSLQKLKWPPFVKRIIKKLYVDSFYEICIYNQLNIIKQRNKK